MKKTNVSLNEEEYQLLIETFDTSSKEKIFSLLKIMKQLISPYTKFLDQQVDTDTSRFQQTPVIYLESKEQDQLAAYFEQINC